MISVQTAALRRAIGIAAKTTDRRATIPVLNSLKVSANGALHIEACNLDQWMRASIAYDGPEAAPFLIRDQRYLCHVLKGGDDIASLRSVDGRLACDVGAMSIVEKDGAHVDDFPLRREVATVEMSATLGAAALSLIAKVSGAMSSEETRYYLSGIFIERTGDWSFRAVATDGHRLHVADIAAPDLTGEATGILPSKAVRTLTGIFGRTEAVSLKFGRAVSSNAVTDTAPQSPTSAPIVTIEGKAGDIGLSLSTKLIDGTFPDYRRVIPAGHAHHVEADLAALLRAIVALTPPWSRETPALKLNFAGQSLTVSLKSAIFADASIVVPLKAPVASPIEIGFNGLYLVELLTCLAGPSVVIGMDNASAPTRFESPEDTSFFGILMPMRV